MPSARKLLADALLGQPVEQWIAEQRDAGKQWHVLARDLAAATDGKVDVAVQTLQMWVADAALLDDGPERAAVAL